MTKSPSEFRHQVRQIVFPKEVKKEEQTERKRKRERERYRNEKKYISVTLKFNKQKKKDLVNYKTAKKNAQKLGIPLAVYFKKTIACPSSQIGYIPSTQEEQRILRKIILEGRKHEKIDNEVENLIFSILQHAT